MLKSFVSMVVLVTACQVAAQELAAAPSYPKMAPISEYLMDRTAEIALARTAAPVSISADAEVLVLGSHGFESVAKGKNGFVCFVGRGFTSAADPDFFNPKVRVPMCVNAPAARSYLARLKQETAWVLSGQTKAQLSETISRAMASKELPAMEPGSIGYMMGKEGYGGDVAPHWPSHIMFFYSDLDPAIWGANVKGSPIIGIADPTEHLTQFVIEAKHWSDGTPFVQQAPTHKHQ